MRSLFIISLPRSWSCDVYDIAGESLGLEFPSWAISGEILNPARYGHNLNKPLDTGAKYTTMERDPALFLQLSDFLAHVTCSEGFIYKDVVQPFVIAAWRGLAQFNVLRIERPLADIAYSVLAQRWYYPRLAARDPGATGDNPLWAWLLKRLPKYYTARLPQLSSRALEDAVIQGLVRAEQALAAIPAQVVSYDVLVNDECALERTLAALYPQARLKPVAYRNAAFFARRERVLRRRKTRRFQDLQARIEQIRVALDHPLPGQN